MTYLGFSIPASASVVFSTDFLSVAPVEFSGITNTESVQGYADLDAGFADNFLRNTTAGDPANSTVLTLTDLTPHVSIDIKFLLAVIDSWDGDSAAYSNAPDYFNVTVDGTPIFSETFDNGGGSMSFDSSPTGVELSYGNSLGFNTSGSAYYDAAYDMGLVDEFNNIPHSSETLTIAWFASGEGWTGDNNESWAIDNLEISINAVPIPSAIWLLGSGLIGILGIRRKFKS